jgi:CRP-like cAMP-binding protein
MEISKNYIHELIREEGIVAAYAPHEELFREGDAPQFLFYVRNGTVVLLETTDPEKPVAKFSIGKLVGVHELITGATYRFTAISENQSSMMKMERARFDDLFENDAQFRMSLVKLISSEMNHTRGGYE